MGWPFFMRPELYWVGKALSRSLKRESFRDEIRTQTRELATGDPLPVHFRDKDCGAN